MKKANSLRKEGTVDVMTSAILGLVVVLVIVAVVPTVVNIFLPKSEIEKCRASVSAKAFTVKAGSAGTGLVDPVQLNLECHTEFLVAKKDGLYAGSRRSVSFSDSRFSGMALESQLKTAVADKMRDCWYMFGKGEIDLFAKLDGDFHCVECSEILFSNDEKSGVQKDVPALNDFSTFLAKNSANEKETYAKYLYKQDVTDLGGIGLNTMINTTKQYGIIYYTNSAAYDPSKGLLATVTDLPAAMFRDCVWGVQKLEKAAGSVVGEGLAFVFTPSVNVAGCAGGIVTGIVTGDNIRQVGKTIGVGVVPVEELQAMCGRLY